MLNQLREDIKHFNSKNCWLEIRNLVSQALILLQLDESKDAQFQKTVFCFLDCEACYELGLTNGLNSPYSQHGLLMCTQIVQWLIDNSTDAELLMKVIILKAKFLVNISNDLEAADAFMISVASVFQVVCQAPAALVVD